MSAAVRTSPTHCSGQTKSVIKNFADPFYSERFDLRWPELRAIFVFKIVQSNPPNTASATNGAAPVNAAGAIHLAPRQQDGEKQLKQRQLRHKQRPAPIQRIQPPNKKKYAATPTNAITKQRAA